MTGETPPVRNGDYFSLLSVNCMRYEKSPYITVNRSRFSSKGHMTLLISEFQSTETWSKSSLWVLKEKYNSWLRVQALNTIYINIYIYIYIYIYIFIYIYIYKLGYHVWYKPFNQKNYSFQLWLVLTSYFLLIYLPSCYSTIQKANHI